MFQANSNECDTTNTMLVFCLNWSMVIFELTCVSGSDRMRKPEPAVLSMSNAGVERLQKWLCLTSRKNWRNDCDDGWFMWNWKAWDQNNNQPVTKSRTATNLDYVAKLKISTASILDCNVAKACRAVSCGFCETKTLPVDQMWCNLRTSQSTRRKRK